MKASQRSDNQSDGDQQDKNLVSGPHIAGSTQKIAKRLFPGLYDKFDRLPKTVRAHGISLNPFTGRLVLLMPLSNNSDLCICRTRRRSLELALLSIDSYKGV